MAHKRRVMPASEGFVGMLHPTDGPLASQGSLWSHDTFTDRRLHDGSVVLVQDEEVTSQKLSINTGDTAVTVPAVSVTSDRPKITKR